MKFINQESDWVWFAVFIEKSYDGKTKNFWVNHIKQWEDLATPSVFKERYEEVLTRMTKNGEIRRSKYGQLVKFMMVIPDKKINTRLGVFSKPCRTAINDEFIYEQNPDMSHYSLKEQKALDIRTIKFYNKWLEEKPMKASENEIKLWKRVKYETYINSNGKKRIKRVDKWVCVGTKKVQQPISVEKEPIVYKVSRKKRPQRIERIKKTGWIDPKTFTGDITKTTWPALPIQYYIFKEQPHKRDVGIKTFNQVKYGLKKYLKENLSKDEKILNRFAELRFIKYNAETLRKYAAWINESSEKALRKEVA